MTTNAFEELKRIENLAAVGVAPAIEEVRRVFPWVESVVVAAVSYLSPEREADDDAPRGLVARVARSADYHTVMRHKLENLARRISDDHPGARLEICVDTCPIPERKLAVLAGIARRGKSGNVFVEGCGSYIALGEIITDVSLPISTPLEGDICGSCTRCMDACPAHAITSPFVVDQTRCLSALTQTSGIIFREQRPFMKNRIYGCDVCQEVCPLNSPTFVSGNPFPETPETAKSDFPAGIFPGPCPELIPLITMDAAMFREKVKESSIGWIRRTRIRRNAAIAVGNLRCESAVPALIDMLVDENPILRATAAWALGEIASSRAIEALKSALVNERDTGVIEEVQAALVEKS